jgi:hypothetical protein
METALRKLENLLGPESHCRSPRLRQWDSDLKLAIDDHSNNKRRYTGRYRQDCMPADA